MGRRVHGCWRVALWAQLLLAAACSSNRFGESLLTPTVGSSVSEAAPPLALPATFPGSGSLNLHHAQRFSSGGATAEASADAQGAGHASCTVTENGEGWAELEVGQVLPPHGGTASMAVTAVLRLDCAYELSGEVGSGPGPAGSVALKAVILDSQRHIVKRQMLVEVELGQNAGKGGGRLERSFDFALDPGLAYQILVAGRVDLRSSTPGSKASALLEVKDLDLTIGPAPSNP